MLDLLRICLEAGLSLDSALNRVSRELKGVAPVLSRELGQYSLEIRTGLPRRRVLLNMAQRNQVESLTGVINVLIQSSRFGTDVLEALRVYSQSLREERMQMAEERGNKIPTRMAFPLILLLLPLLVVIMGPALIRLFENMQHNF